MHLRAERRLPLLPLVLGLAGTLLLAGCSEWGPAQGPESGGTMRVSVPALPSTWNPDSTTGGPSAQPVRDVEAPLLQLTPHSQQAAPGLARSWRYDSSRTRLTVTLRPKAEFSTGRRVTAEDVVFSVHQWLAGPRHGAYYASLISGVKVDGTHKVVFDLTAPSSAMTDALTLTSSAIVPDRFAGRSATDFYARPIGAGPFAIRSTDGDEIDLARNKHFYDRTHPLLTRLDYTSADDPATVLRSVSHHRTDLAEGLPTSDVADAPAHVRVVTTPSQSTSVLTFSPASALTADPQLRKAVSLAVDRSALVKSVYDGQAGVARGLLPGDQPGAKACTSCRWSTHSASLAAKDLATVPGHDHLTLLVDSADATDVRTAQALTPMLAQAGMTVRTLPVSATTLGERVSSGRYEMALQTLSAETPSPAEALQTLVTGHYLTGPTALPTAQDALDAVGSATTKSQLTEAVTAFEQQVFATTAAVPLVDPYVVDVVATPVRGLAVGPTGLYHSAELWLKG